MTNELPTRREVKSRPQSEFVTRLENRWNTGRFVCVGLDTDFASIPAALKGTRSVGEVMYDFNKQIVDATHDLVSAFKPNIAFYEAEGVEGMYALERTIALIKCEHPDITVILDAKRADIGNTNGGYVRAAFDYLGADAITVHPYLGREALQPFLDRKDKGVIVLARTSNPGAGEFQDFLVGDRQEPLHCAVARQVADEWNENGNCAIVVGATYPDELSTIRGIVGDLPILIPGIGAQGGDVELTVNAGKDSRKQGMIINSSRGIIFAAKEGDFALAARNATLKLHQAINQYR